MSRIAFLILLLCAGVWAGGIDSQIHIVKITTDRATFQGTSKQTLAAPVLCVGPDGLMMAIGFSLDEPRREERNRISVVVVLAGGEERRAKILGGDSAMNCTFFRLLPEGNRKPPVPVPLKGAPLKLGEKAVVFGRHGEVMNFALWRRDLEVEAVVDHPRTLYALRGAQSDHHGSIVATADGRLVGFLAARPTFPDRSGMMMGVGSQTTVVVPAAEYVELARTLPFKDRRRAWLGVTLSPFDRPREEYFNVGKNWPGALVTSVSPGSPAAKAGIRVHDLLQGIGPTRFVYERDRDWEPLLRGVQRLALDVPLKCRLVRFALGSSGDYEARPIELTIVLAVRPTDFADAPETEIKEYGMVVKPVTDDWRRGQAMPEGVVGAVVVSTKRASSVQLAGVMIGDLIQAVDGKAVKDPKTLVSLLAEAGKSGRKKVVLLVRRRGNKTAFIPVER